MPEMIAKLLRIQFILFALLFASPALAQFTILDQAQDAAASPQEPTAPPPPICGTQTLTIAKMGWPSAEILAEIHAELLRRNFACDARTIPGELSASISSITSSGQPSIIPEMWATRAAENWNAAITAQSVRPAAPSYVGGELEGWFMPGFVAIAQPDLKSINNLAAALPVINNGTKVRFISCPPDWACALFNRNLISALGLGGMFEVEQPANRLEMDRLIGEAVSRREPFVFYYWQPNAILSQFDFVPLDMGTFDGDAAKCLAQTVCAAPQPSAFPKDTVVTALAESVFTATPIIGSYFQRASMPFSEMNSLLAQLNETGAEATAVAQRFVNARKDIWGPWIAGLDR
jgi:glycine betaine/proline transport system substrate-binding protein